MNIVLAPLSNDPARDWPIANYRDLVGLILEANARAEITLLGAPVQRPLLNEIARRFDPERVRNAAGRSDWRQSADLLARAHVVVTNNSGLGHVAATSGIPLVCVFSASHNVSEWMPLGERVTVLYAHPPCAPCGKHGAFGCPIDKRCLRSITPEIVCAEVFALAQRSARDAESLPSAWRA